MSLPEYLRDCWGGVWQWDDDEGLHGMWVSVVDGERKVRDDLEREYGPTESM